MGRKPCCSKFGLNRGAWTAMEDQILTSYIRTHGDGNWRNLPEKAGLKRCGKSCRLRWMNYLRPDIKRGNISHDEEDLIIRLHKILGNRWSLIAGRLPGRTDNEIKNYWNTTLAKKANPQPPLPLSSREIAPKNKSQATRPRVVRARPRAEQCDNNASPKCPIDPQQGQEASPRTEFRDLFPEDHFLGFCRDQVRVTKGGVFGGDHGLLMEEKIMLENWTATFCANENEKLDMNSLTFLLDSDELP